MTSGERLIAGIEASIEWSTEQLEEAFAKVPLEQWHWYTQNTRKLFYTQLRFYQALGGIGLPLWEPSDQPAQLPAKKVNPARMRL